MPSVVIFGIIMFVSIGYAAYSIGEIRPFLKSRGLKLPWLSALGIFWPYELVPLRRLAKGGDKTAERLFRNEVVILTALLSLWGMFFIFL